MSSPSIVIIGAGVLGLSTAFELKRRGHVVTVVDPGTANASQVAAGMVAPAMEAAIDDVSADRAALFRAGRDRWPAFAEASGVALARRPAEWRGGDVDAVEARLKRLGFAARRDGDRLITEEDYQIEPEQGLAALRAVLGEAVVVGRATGIAANRGGWSVELDGRSLQASAVVLATGAEAALVGTPVATRRLVDGIQPIRGQIGSAARDLTAHVVRGPGAYVAPMTGGAVIGATMEPGRRDTAPDEAVGERLTQAAWRVLGRPPEPLEIEWRAGVRGASADGLPMAGPAPDGTALYLALAPRRNGWLLGPMVGAVVADAIEGRTPSPEARALDPRRF
ncbi:FAD-binding oxidoreductase [Brevundimonas sp.]|jgi:glycine oxidase|uniref:NAD(P)/FAD-dependent oxidoreductase n=1 Tax=Brevundimonas sp. TaxID=1871086 RepID=UPI0017C57C06|nr:FAD-binding oxidoreductase [Brevundimonas sp.]MBA4806950.1 FAD-dependent oxidoreductase [Brevundimonas sp.]